MSICGFTKEPGSIKKVLFGDQGVKKLRIFTTSIRTISLKWKPKDARRKKNDIVVLYRQFLNSQEWIVSSLHATEYLRIRVTKYSDVMYRNVSSSPTFSQTFEYFAGFLLTYWTPSNTFLIIPQLPARPEIDFVWHKQLLL